MAISEDGNLAGGLGASGAPGNGTGLGGNAAVSLTGTVQSVTDDTLTITTSDGQTVALSLGSDTTYNAQAAASAADVKTGATVEVQLDLSGSVQPGASAAPSSGSLGTASSVTVGP